jgi:hypothetical protein
MINVDRHEDISRAVACSAGAYGGKRSPELQAAQLAKVGQVAEMKVLDKTEQLGQASGPNEKPESCYCSALPKGSPCLSCYMRWLATRRSKEDMAEEWDWLADQQERTTDLRKKNRAMEKDYLLKGAALSRPSWNDDDFDVVANGEVVGRIERQRTGMP